MGINMQDLGNSARIPLLDLCRANQPALNDALLLQAGERDRNNPWRSEKNENIFPVGLLPCTPRPANATLTTLSSDLYCYDH